MKAPSPGDYQFERDLLALDALVPSDASVAVSEHELPHISRMNLFSLRDGLFDADYLLYDIAGGYLGADIAEPALARGQYRLVAQKSDLALLKRVDPPPVVAP
jgi:hypothetical protein